MAVYVDSSQNRFGRMVMCHMIADTPVELHTMAEKIGLIRRWFQEPPKASFWHYDVCKTRRTLAVRHGAIEVDRATLVTAMKRIRASGAFGGTSGTDAP